MKLLPLKKALPYLPELILLLAICIGFWGELLEAGKVNYIMLAGILLISALLTWKNRYFALTISILPGCISLFMLLAVFSEYSEFTSGDKHGLQLLVMGISLFVPLPAISFLLPGKYFRRGNKPAAGS